MLVCTDTYTLGLFGYIILHCLSSQRLFLKSDNDVFRQITGAFTDKESQCSGNNSKWDSSQFALAAATTSVGMPSKAAGTPKERAATNFPTSALGQSSETTVKRPRCGTVDAALLMSILDKTVVPTAPTTKWVAQSSYKLSLRLVAVRECSMSHSNRSRSARTDACNSSEGDGHAECVRVNAAKRLLKSI